MGNVSLWTYSVILLCLGGITFSQRFPYENPSKGHRCGHSKLNLRNFLGSKLIQRLADSPPPQYETYDHPMSSPDQQMAPPPPLPLPPPPPPPPRGPLHFSRSIVPYEFQNQRMPMQGMPPPPPPPPQGMGIGLPPQGMGMGLPPQGIGMGLPPQGMGMGLPPPPHAMGPPAHHCMGLPPHHSIGPLHHSMGPPPHHSMGPPPHHSMGPSPQSMNHHENVYTETVTTSCPCGTCGTCSECEAANQDYSYNDEPCSCGCDGGCPCEGGCPCAAEGGCPCSCEGGCPCACEECPCACRGGGGGGGPSGGRCPCFSGGDASYPSEKDYHDRDHNYDDYSAPECSCCCECSANQDCPCAYGEEPHGPLPPPSVRERPGFRGYPPPNLMHENYMDRPPEPHLQRHSESYVSVVGQSSYKPIPPPREMQPPGRYSQYEEPMEPPQFVKMPPRRSFGPPPDMLPPPMHLPHLGCPEEPMHHAPEPQGRMNFMPPHISEVPEGPMHHAEMSERTMHRYHEPQPVEPMHQEVPREWRRMPPPGPPRHMMEEDTEPPLPLYRNFPPIPNRFTRKYRQPMKPPFFEGLSYSDGC